MKQEENVKCPVRGHDHMLKPHAGNYRGWIMECPSGYYRFIVPLHREPGHANEPGTLPEVASRSLMIKRPHWGWRD